MRIRKNHSHSCKLSSSSISLWFKPSGSAYLRRFMFVHICSCPQFEHSLTEDPLLLLPPQPQAASTDSRKPIIRRFQLIGLLTRHLSQWLAKTVSAMNRPRRINIHCLFVCWPCFNYLSTCGSIEPAWFRFDAPSGLPAIVTDTTCNLLSSSVD